MIWFLGDVHGHFEHIAQAVDAAQKKPEAVILLGDVEAPIPLHECMRDVESRGVAWYWIIGNHDTDSLENFDNIADPTSMAHNIDGLVINIDGIRVAGLGGVFRGDIWHPCDGKSPTFTSYVEYERALREQRQTKARLSRMDLVQNQAVPPESHHWVSQVLDQSRAGKLLKHRSTIFPHDYERLRCQRADILATHEAPSMHPHGFAEIDRLALAMKVRTIFHGHHHVSRAYPQGGPISFQCYGVGYCAIVDESGAELVKEVNNAYRNSSTRHRRCSTRT